MGPIQNQALFQNLTRDFMKVQCLSKDGNTIYFPVKVSMMICIKKDNVNKLKISQVNLYKATKENGKWTAITPLSFNE
jgi:hypothetical protein